MSGAGSRAMSRPSYWIVPEAGRHQAGERLQQRRLAGAVAAEQRHDLALAHVERRVVEDVALAVEGVDALEAQHLALARRMRAAAGDRRRAGAGIDLLHARVGAHLVGRAGHQHLALVHHGDALREAEHAVDVVLDDQHRDVGGDVLDQVGDALALGRREAGERLVEQQHLRLGAERDAEIDQALPAIGELAALDVLDAFEAEEADQLRGLGVDLADSCRCRARR